MPPRLLAHALLLVLLLSVAAHADPILVIDGFLQSVRVSPEQGLRSMDISGPGFSARGNDTMPGLRTPGCSFCTPNSFQRFDDILFATSNSIALMRLSGGMTVGGVTFDSSLFDTSVSFSIQTDLVRLVAPPDNPETFSVFVHFTATGSYTVTDRATSQVVSSGPLTGQGIAEALIRRGQIDSLGREFYVTESVTYRFDNNPPVPEPATLVLFGLGSGGLWLLKRRRAGG